MNSVLLCEGSTDYVLLQYYMRKAYFWEDDRNRQEGIFKIENDQESRKLFCGEHILTVASAGGCSKLKKGLEQALNRNRFASGSHSVFDHIVMITDRDEIGTEEEFVREVREVFSRLSVCHTEEICNNRWIKCEMKNDMGEMLSFSFLLMVVPFEEEGAMETFLLNAIARENKYDKSMIEACNEFVERVDPERRYLSGRRLVTKAKFDAYFSIRTAASQFRERQNILKGIKWEEYTVLQEAFQLLAVLS